MRRITASNLRVHLSEVLEQASGGQIVEVTRRGRALARIEPLRAEMSPEQRRAALADLDALTEELSRYQQVETDVAHELRDMRR